MELQSVTSQGCESRRYVALATRRVPTYGKGMLRSGHALTRRFVHPLCILIAVLVMLASQAAWAQASKPAGPVRIQVRGGAQINATATLDGLATVVRGQLLDDAGAALGGVAITLQVASIENSVLPQPAACDPLARRERRAPRIVGPDKYEVRTDDHGEFCVRTDGSFGRASLKLRFDGDELHDASESAISFEPSSASVAHTVLRFEPAPDLIDLERPSISLTASLRIDRAAANRSSTTTVRREGLVVVLEDERGERLAEGPTGGDGRVRFEVPAKAFAGPGAGELRLRFDGTTALAKAAAAQPIVRRADVGLSLSHPVDVGDPEDGVAIDVDVKTSRGAVTSGVVEAMRGDESVGAGAVRDGKARVIASFSFERAGTVPLELRYVAATPFFRAGQPLDIEVAVRGPGIARQVIIALVVLAVTAWIVFSWRRSPMRAVVQIDDDKMPIPTGRAGVDVVRAEAGQTSYRGSVLDAHDGTPIADARLSVVAPAFQGDGIMTRATSNERGEFVLDAAYRADARLIIDAPAHTKHEQALPKPGVLRITLVTRRRSLLDRLVRWAQRTGAPFDVQPEPTPGHVRRAAFRAQDEEVEVWARGVETAAYGPAMVDEHVEAQLSAGEPRGGRKLGL